jgi:drug/metabolite transporter (DMT)-like permease
VSYVGFASGDFVSVFLSKKLNPILLTVLSCMLRIFFYLLFSPFFWPLLSGLTWQIFIINILIGSSTVLGYVLFYKAISKTNPAIAGSIASSWSAPALLYSIVFLGEKITVVQSLFILLILIGIFLVSFELQALKKISLRQDSGIRYALVVMFLWAVCGSFIKIPIAHIGWYWATLFQLTPSIVLIPFALQKIEIKKLNKSKVFNTLPQLLLYVVITMIAESSYNIAISTGQASLVAPIGGSYSTLFVILAFIFFKDKITKQQIVGVVATIVGIACLAFASV